MGRNLQWHYPYQLVTKATIYHKLRCIRRITANDVNERALYKLKNGSILVGTPNGYTTIIPQEIVHSTYNAKVYLTGIEPKYFPLSEMLNGKSPECATEVVMEEGIPSFQLHFSTLDFIEPRKVRYAYRIKGQLSGWNHTTITK